MRLVLALVALIMIIACGGPSGPQMTVEEYAAACERIGGDLDLESGLDLADIFEQAMAELKELDPPEELRELHMARLQGMEAGLDALRDTGMLQLMDDMQEASQEDDQEKVLELLDNMAELEEKAQGFEDEMAVFEDRMAQAEEDLSPDTRRILGEADCLT